MQVHLPDLPYDCMCCGRSCGGWRILLLPEDLSRLQSSPPTQRVRQAGFVPFGPGPDGLVRLGQRPDGRCVYLRADMLCSLQRESGFAAKPLACRVFPFLPVQTPGGTFVGLSHRCTAVQRGSGRPATVHAEQVATFLVECPGPEIEEPLPLAPGHRLTWEGYLRLEQMAREALCSGAGLWALGARLALLVRGPAREEPWRGAELQASLPPAPPRLPTAVQGEQAGAAALVGWLETDRPEEMGYILQTLPAGAPFHSRRLRRVVDPRPLGLLPPPGDWLTAALARYLDHLLFRKFLARGSGVLPRLWILHLLGPVLRFYMSLSAHLADRPRAVPEDLHRAWDVVEGELVGHVEGLDPLFESVATALGESVAPPSA